MYYRYCFFLFGSWYHNALCFYARLHFKKINSYILDYKWSINFKSHSGSIFSKILLDDISIAKDNEQIIRFQKLIIDIGIFETIFSKPTVDMLTVQNIDLNLKSKSNEEKF